MRQGRLVGPCGAQRIVYVDDLQDARQQRNLIAPKSIRVSAAVGVFVVMPNDRQHQPQGLQWLADVLSRDRVTLHDLPFFGSQVAPLLQNLVGDSDFAEIVQVTSTT